MPPPLHLSSDDKQHFSQVLLQLSRTAELLVSECQRSKPPVGSRAHAWFSVAEPSGVFAHAMQGFLNVEFAVLSGCDHLRALNTLIRTDPVRSTSTVTLMRGALEAFAKAWYFITSAGHEEFLVRYLSSRYAEYRYPLRFGEPLRALNGAVVDPADGIAEVLSELDRLGLPKPERVDITARVSSLLDAAHGADHGRKDYSGLSSVAHAEHAGLGNFLSLDENGAHVALVQSRVLLLDMTSSLTMSVLECLRALIDVFGAQPRHVAILDGTGEQTIGALLWLFQRGGV